MAKSNTALAINNDPTKLPAHLASMGAVGNENIDSKVLATPRLYLLQQLSPQVTKGKPEYVEGAQAGQFINSLSGEATDALFVANLFMQMGYTAFKKRQLGKDFQGVHTSMEAAVAHLNANGLNPLDYDIDESHTHTLAVIDPQTGDIKTPILFSLKRTGLSVSRSWNTQIVTQNPNVPRFGSIWKLESSLVNGAKGSYYVPKVGFAGWAPEALATDLMGLFTSLHGKQPLPQDDGAY